MCWTYHWTQPCPSVRHKQPWREPWQSWLQDAASKGRRASPCNALTSPSTIHQQRRFADRLHSSSSALHHQHGRRSCRVRSRPRKHCCRPSTCFSCHCRSNRTCRSGHIDGTCHCNSTRRHRRSRCTNYLSNYQLPQQLPITNYQLPIPITDPNCCTNYLSNPFSFGLRRTSL